MTISDTQKLIESGSGENDDSNIHYYCQRSCLISWKQHMSTLDRNGQEVKDNVLFVIRRNILYVSSFLNFCFFLSVKKAELKKKYCNVTQHVIDLFFGTLWAVSIEEKDTEMGIRCTSNPFALHEFSMPDRLDWYAVRTRWILPIHYELSRPFDQIHNSSSPEEQNRRGSGLSAIVHLLYVQCPIHTTERQWPRICKQNNTKLGWYVARNEARAWKAETFSKSRISWKVQPRCLRHAGCLDVWQQHKNLVWRTMVYPKQEKLRSAFRHQDKPLWNMKRMLSLSSRSWGF